MKRASEVIRELVELTRQYGDREVCICGIAGDNMPVKAIKNNEEAKRNGVGTFTLDGLG